MTERVEFTVGGIVYRVLPLTIWTLRHGAWDAIQRISEPSVFLDQVPHMLRVVAHGLEQETDYPTIEEYEAAVEAQHRRLDRAAQMSEFRGLDTSLKKLLDASGMGVDSSGEERPAGDPFGGPQQSGTTS